MRIFVQGDRDATGVDEAARELGRTCKERDIELNLGEKGQLVRILTESGARCFVHRARHDEPNTPEHFNGEVINCREWATGAHAHMLGFGRRPEYERLCWAIRLATLADNSDGFLFFPGRQGTMAHLIPILAFIMKGEVEKGVTLRRVALVGWAPTTVNLLDDLMGIRRLESEPLWFCNFRLEDASDALDWLTRTPSSQ